MIADSFGRPWRIGQADVAIGCAGLRALDDWRGRTDAHGRELTATVVAIADELAAAADLARDKASGGPAVLVRGAGLADRRGRAGRPAALQRAAAGANFAGRPGATWPGLQRVLHAEGVGAPSSVNSEGRTRARASRRSRAPAPAPRR